MAESSLLRMAQRLLGQPQFHFGYRDQIKARVKYTLSAVKNRGGAFWLLLGAFSFAVNATASKLIMSAGLSSWRLAQIRAIGSGLIMVIFMLVLKRNELKVKLREIPKLLIYGAVGVALVNIFYFIAIAKLPVGIALIIEFTAPIWIAIWIKFVRKGEVAKSMWGALALSLFGLALVAQIWRGLTLDGIGLIAAILDAFALAAYLMIGESIKGQHSATSMVTWGLIGASVFWLITIPLWTFPKEIFVQQIELQGKLPNISVPGWGLLLWIITVGTILPYACVVIGLRKTSATIAGVISMSEAIMAGIIAWIWLGESWNLIQLIGAFAVIAGIIIANRSRTTQIPLVG
jgi:drug/metabolite transporter (DMT)-like permease